MDTYINEAYTYSSLNPFTWSILICLTIVLLPDSPAPEIREINMDKTHYAYHTNLQILGFFPEMLQIKML